MKLLSVYRHKNAVNILYEFLEDRMQTPEFNISHRKMPSFDEHTHFFYRGGDNEEPPYRAWYFILNQEDSIIGSIYLTKAREVGVYLVPEARGKGLGKLAVDLLMVKWPGRFLANINPANARSIAMFEELGFKHIQNTYERPQT